MSNEGGEREREEEDCTKNNYTKKKKKENERKRKSSRKAQLSAALPGTRAICDRGGVSQRGPGRRETRAFPRRFCRGVSRQGQIFEHQARRESPSIIVSQLRQRRVGLARPAPPRTLVQDLDHPPGRQRSRRQEGGERQSLRHRGHLDRQGEVVGKLGRVAVTRRASGVEDAGGEGREEGRGGSEGGGGTPGEDGERALLKKRRRGDGEEVSFSLSTAAESSSAVRGSIVDSSTRATTPLFPVASPPAPLPLEAAAAARRISPSSPSHAALTAAAEGSEVSTAAGESCLAPSSWSSEAFSKSWATERAGAIE